MAFNCDNLITNMITQDQDYSNISELGVDEVVNNLLKVGTIIAMPSEENLTTSEENLTDVQKILLSWGLECLNEKFRYITLNTLQYMTEGDLQELFSQQSEINLKIEFRKKLVKWRQENGYQITVPTLSDTVSFNSSILTWVEESPRRSSPSPSCSTLCDLNTTSFSLKEFLETTRGKKILDMCKNDKLLENEAREILITNIVQFFMERDECMKPADFNKIKDDILSFFPKENPDYYYKGGKRPTGKLYNKYRNSACNLRKVGFFKGEKKIKLNEDTISNLNTEDLQVDSQEDLQILNQNKQWLLVCQEPWATVEIKWKSTFPLRKRDLRSEDKTILQFLENWPLLRSTNGFRLIDIDFELLFEKKSLNLINNWKIFKEKAPKLLIGYLKQPRAQKELLNLSTNEDISNYQILSLLHSALPPSGRITKPKGEQKKFWKPSIEDSIKSFFIELEVAGELETKLNERRQLYKELGLTLQPLIIVFKNLLNKRYAIRYDEIFYTFDSIIPCIDICFKIFFVLNLEFPIESINVWHFMQKYFYEINTNFDKSINTNVLSLISNFN